jgi:hypothetical protein
MDASVVRGNCVCDHRGDWLRQYQPLGVLFALVEAATRTDFEGLARNNVGLPLPAISQVTAVDDQFGIHSLGARGNCDNPASEAS